MSVYQIQNFNFQYPFSSEQITLRGDFCINAGDCILLQGVSGSGKSTLLAALKGLIPNLINGKLGGNILFNGEDITTLDEKKLLNIGYLQQNPDNQLVCNDVYSELAFGLENLGYSAREIANKIHAIANQFSISELLQREVKTLSGGEKQKINLLAILLLEPEVLLLDEPTAFLDPHSAHEIMRIIQDYLQNKTVIIVEHNLHYLRHLINRCIVINNHGMVDEQQLSQIDWLAKLPPQASCSHNSKLAPLLEIKQLTFSYPPQSKPLLLELDLTLKSGEIVAITGNNGCGKSTLLKLISGLVPSAHSIYWESKDISTIKRNDLWQNVQLVWQNPEAHFLYSSVAQELADNPAQIKQFNLSNQATHNPFSLSEGQKRRLSLAISLKPHTQLVLLDEPTFGQDYANKLRLAEYLSQMASNGCGFILVSHDLEFVNAIATHHYRLENGRLHLC